ncbi:family 16 glycoside hydrolase [Roseateles sp.]|uniref:family 16 glycoside hydrolase n=1 Tax=Roseateles sp. TaxID=1971397 RepID=UPI0025D88747|nr:family 16 glycoside hydrolase [Roseateles sp.]MBV8037229.1 DUF1080 domain-containing protein [Roseateles sp.]
MQLKSSRVSRALVLCAALVAACGVIAAVEEPIDSRFVRAQADPFRGDYQGSGGLVAQVYPTDGGKYRANILTAFDQPDAKAVVALLGTRSDQTLSLNGDGWSGVIANGKLTLKGPNQQAELQHVTRVSPTMGAKPPPGAVILFDGRNLDALATKDGKDWLKEAPGPANAKIVDGALEVIPGSGGGLISRKQFGDARIHVEFRTLGAPSNSGVFIQARYEADINETYGKLEGSLNGNLGNCTPPETLPRVRPTRPVLEWNTYDIDFHAPRFNAAGQKIEDAWVTLYLNGVKLYDRQVVRPIKGAAERLGEAPKGPLYLQEHGMPVQFRNVWVEEKEMPGTGQGAEAFQEPKKKGKKQKDDDKAEQAAPAEKADEAGKTEKSDKPARKGGAKGGKESKAPQGLIPGGKVVEVAPANTSGPFVHPGVIVNRGQLDEIKRRVAAGIEPQKTAFAALRAHRLGALDYAPSPVPTVECGPYSKPDIGCKAEQADSEAAYAQALLWYVTGNKAYAENAIKIMNAWANTLTGGHTNANGPVQAAWTGAVWPRAAEIIRASYPGWSAAEVGKFQALLRTQYVPILLQGSGENGNKELAQSEALINIGVFNDDRATFNAGLDMWRGRTPATIYLTSDGAAPLQPPRWGPAIWGNKGFIPKLVDGLQQETARDSGHAALALAAMAGAAETALQQGVDLYGEQAKRLVAALEFNAQYLPPNNTPPPEHLEFNLHPTWEMAYNHYHDRLGLPLPLMGKVLQGSRPTGVNHMMNWETLTHAGMGNIGLPPRPAKP